MPGPGRRKRSSGRGAVPPLRGLVPLVVALVVWQLLVGGRHPYYASPSSWPGGLRILPPGSLVQAIVDTLVTWLGAMVVATVVGTVLGILIGRIRLLDRVLGPFLEFCRVMPASAVVPIAVLVAGYTVNMQLAVVVFGASWPILLGVRSSAQRIRQQLLDVGRSLQLRRLAMLRKIVFPSVVPGLLVGIRIAAPVTLVVVLLVQVLTQVGGLGALMITAQQNFNSAQLYGLVCIVGVLGLLAGWGVSLLSRRAERYWSGT